MARSELLSPMNRTSVSEMIINRITEEIIAGKLKPGDKIPTEMELSSALGVGRNSVREATKTLEAFGVLEVRRAEGTFVTEHFSQKMLNPQVYGVILQAESAEVESFKAAIYRSLLYMIVPTLTDEKLARLEAAADDIKRVCANDPTEDDIYDVNVAFHECLAGLCENQLMQELMQVIIRISKYHRLRSIRQTIKEGKPMQNYDVCHLFAECLQKRSLAEVDTFMDQISKEWVRLVFPEEQHE